MSLQVLLAYKPVLNLNLVLALKRLSEVPLVTIDRFGVISTNLTLALPHECYQCPHVHGLTK